MFNCLGHIGTMFEPYLSYFFNIFACRCLEWLNLSVMYPKQKNTLKLHYLDHIGAIWAILGPCFGYFSNLFTSGCPKWFKVLWKSHAYHLENTLNVYLLGPYWGHVMAILGHCFGYVYIIFAFKCMIWLLLSLKTLACQKDEYSLMLNL